MSKDSNSSNSSNIINRKRKNTGKSEQEEIKYFDINDHNITDLSSLIDLINDLIQKNVPPKKILNKMPKKLYKLINILEPLEELNSLIGLEKLKHQLLEQLLYFVQGNSDIIMLHTAIEGPPGTGKTTIARLMSKIYSGIGILKKNKFTIVKREDLIGAFLGETTLKTMETLNRCLDGVMLIDEAYSLGTGSSGYSNGDSYSIEAVNAINEFLTENCHRIICIIVGYKYELDKCFFSLNPGLRRRFPWTFTIDRFNKEQLTNILIEKVNNSDYDLAEDIDDKYIQYLIKIELFNGNGGDIDTILSRAKIIYSRVNFGKENDYIFTKEILEEAFDKFYDNKKDKIDKPPIMMYS